MGDDEFFYKLLRSLDAILKLKRRQDEKRDKKEYIEWINDDRNRWGVDRM